MYKVAIIDDEKSVAAEIRALLEEYGSERKAEFQIQEYGSGDEFLRGGDADFDIILLDINMPGSNGIQVAKRIRRANGEAVIIFCTNYAQYALNGYEVNALGYLIKPIKKGPFWRNLDRTLNVLRNKRQEKLLVKTKDGQVVVNPSDIVYIEVERHNLFFHILAERGTSELRTRGTMREMFDRLQSMNFAKCSACYLVNMEHITSVQKGVVCCTGGANLFISRKFQKEFMARFMQYIEEQDGING